MPVIGEKLSVVSPSGTFSTVKLVAAAAARTKGAPELLGACLAFPYSTYLISVDQILVYKAQQVMVEAQGVNTEIASVNFTILQKVYWDAAAFKVTNVVGANTLCGRVLLAVDYTAGLVAGNQLLIELDPSAA